MGLSPRGRGNPLGPLGYYLADGSIPAWAGQPIASPAVPKTLPVYPRVGGATHPDCEECQATTGLSPRGRGNPIPATSERFIRRSIPAWAGQPATSPDLRSAPEVYPRVGGATVNGSGCKTRYMGLSPRGRGNPLTKQRCCLCLRSIPAWAGQPHAARQCVRPQRVYPRVGGATAIRAPVNIRHHGLSPRGRGNRRRPCHTER